MPQNVLSAKFVIGINFKQYPCSLKVNNLVRDQNIIKANETKQVSFVRSDMQSVLHCGSEQEGHSISQLLLK